jgi:tetratricopeptide (TPR) repeat protein
MARISAITVTIILLTSFCLSQRNFSPPGSQDVTNFSVNVTTSRGTPASNARVELRDLTTGQIVASGYTNDAGTLELANVQNSIYTLDVTQGLSELKEKVDLRMGDRNLNLHLPGGDEGSTVGSSSTVSVAQYKVPSKARKEYSKAEEALQKLKKDEAASHLAKALEVFPNFAEALTLRAVMSMDKQDHVSALKDLDAAIKADPTYAFAYFAMGATYNGLSKFDDAMRTLERGISLSPNAWQGYFELGKAHVGKANYQKALTLLDRAQSLVSKDYPSLHLVKAHALLALKQYPDAMNELQVFLTEAPNDARTADARRSLDEVKAYVGK